MKKVLTLVFCTILCFAVFSYCIKNKEYKFTQSKDNINSIQIISLKYTYGESESDVPEEIVVCEIENISEFLEDFSNIKVQSINPPYDLSAITNATAIKIVYNDGEFERIFPYGKDTADNFNGTITLDENQFADLIKKYVKEQDFKIEYNFLDQESAITSIQIVRVYNYEFEWLLPKNQTVICEIDDIDTFLQKFSKVDCYLNKGTPTKVRPNKNIIKINYEGGHYELIDVNGQTKAYYDDGAYDGYRYFDKEQFENLISEYVD